MKKINTIYDIPLVDYLEIENKTEELREDELGLWIYGYMKDKYDMTDNELSNYFISLSNINKDLPEFQYNMLLNNIEYEFVDLDNITTGEFIDLDTYDKDITYCYHVASILWKEIGTRYNGSNPQSMKNISTGHYLLGLKKYQEWKSTFITNFNYLYMENENSDNDDPLSNLSEDKQFADEFGWYPMLHQAANEQYLNISKVTETKASEFLTYLNFIKRKTELDNTRLRQSYKSSH